MPLSIKAQFFGRKTIIQDLVHGVLTPHQPLDFSLIGPKMIGKSRMLRYLAAEDGPLKGPAHVGLRPERFQDGQSVLVGHYDCDWPKAKEHLTQFVSQGLEDQLQAEKSLTIDWSAVKQSTSPGHQIKSMVQQLEQQQIRVVLLLDNFDHVLRSKHVTPDMINELRPLTNELGLIIASEQPLHDINQTLAASPLFNVMHQHFIGLLDPAATREWIDAYHKNMPLTAEIKDNLFELTGGHPFLLARVNDIMLELNPLGSNNKPIDKNRLPLIRLRLAEHGRPLFENIWRRLQEGIGKEARPLVETLTRQPLAIGDIPPTQITALNWLINQAIVTFDTRHYFLFSPLFARFMAHLVQPAQTLSNNGPEYESLLQALAPKEAQLLRYFREHTNKTVTFEELLTHIWQQPDASARRVQEAIRRLRSNLNKHSPPLGVIKSERGVGYRYIPSKRS